MPSHKNLLKGFGSVAIHSGHEPESNNAHLTPVYASSTYVFDSADQGMRKFNGEEKGYIYSRWGNPTMAEAEQKISALESFGLEENGLPLQLKTILNSSGMAAISALLLGILKPGDTILTHFSLYGGTQELMDKVLPQLGIETVIVDLRNKAKAEEALKNNSNLKLLYLETPANPTIQCVDIQELTLLTRKYNLMVAVDNTFGHRSGAHVERVMHCVKEQIARSTCTGGLGLVSIIQDDESLEHFRSEEHTSELQSLR